MKKNQEISALRKARKNCDMSLEDVYIKTGITASTLGDIERGEQQNFDLNIIPTLCDTYECKRLARYFCGNECPIGTYLNYEKLKMEDKENLASIFLNVQDCLNEMNNLDMKQLVKICKDNIIDNTELETYTVLRNNLKEMASAYNALIRWEEENTIGQEKRDD